MSYVQTRSNQGLGFVYVGQPTEPKSFDWCCKFSIAAGVVLFALALFGGKRRR